MDSDLKIIKKKYGEKMSRLCRELFPTLLEIEGKLSELMLKLFEPSRSLYEDIITNHLENDFQNYIYSNLEEEEKELIFIKKTPKELLSEVGYELYECSTEEEIQSFRKYYQYNEELCTFKDRRLNRYYVFFAVKKNVDEIKRENFKNPEREDEYGTSVISIQFSRSTSNILSIKNRYNHTVQHPDSTFSNNLENIIEGLTKSFEMEYGLNLEHYKNNFMIPGYVKAENGKFYKYYHEYYNVYYCENNIIIDNGKIMTKYKDKERYLIIESFILALVEKKIYIYDERITESFIDGIQEIEKIYITKCKETENKIIGIICKNNKVIIEINKENNIIGYENNSLEEINNNFLNNNTSLEYINLPKLRKINDWFLVSNIKLKSICFPKLESVGNYFLAYNHTLEEVSLPKLRKAGNSFLKSNNSLTELSLPLLEELGNLALRDNTSLQRIYMPKVIRIGEEFLNYNNKLLELSLPSLEEFGNYALINNFVLNIVNLPNLRKTGLYFLNKKNTNLTEVYFPYYNRKHEYIKLAEYNNGIETPSPKKEKRLYKKLIQRLHR